MIDQLESLRAEEEDHAESATTGVLLDQLQAVEQRLLAFDEALGGAADTVTDLPFTEEAGLDHMPEPLHVRHDTEMLNQVTSWLLQDQHIGLVGPYDTGETAFREIVRRVREDDKTLLLVVNEIEVLEADLLSPPQVAGDAGVRLFLTGTPERKRQVAEIRGTGLAVALLREHQPVLTERRGRVHRPFAGVLRDEPYEGQAPDLFIRATIEDIHERTESNPRSVRIEYHELFTKAAFVWYRTGQEISRIQFTPELRHRRFGMGR